MIDKQRNQTLRIVVALIGCLLICMASATFAASSSTAPNGSVSQPNIQSKYGNTPQSITGYAKSIGKKDLSMQFIGDIVGTQWYNLIDNQKSKNYLKNKSKSSSKNDFLGQIFLVLNAAALALTGLFVAFTGISTLFATGHEGVTLGQRHSTLYVPARIIITIIALVPMAGGFSLAQVGMMYVTKASVGVADTMFKHTANYISHGGITVQPDVPKLSQLSKAMLQSDVCSQALNNYQPKTIKVTNKKVALKKYKINFGANSSANSSSSNSGSLKNNSSPVCGSFSYQKKNLSKSKTSSYCKNNQYSHSGPMSRGHCSKNNKPKNKNKSNAYRFHKQNMKALYNLHKNMQSIAKKIAKGKRPAKIAFFKAESTYRRQVTKHASTFLSKIKNKKNSNQKAKKQIKQIGWIGAGAYYWFIVRRNQRIARIIRQAPNISSPDQKRIKKSGKGGATNKNIYAQPLAAMSRAKHYLQNQSNLSVYSSYPKLYPGHKSNKGFNSLITKYWTSATDSLPGSKSQDAATWLSSQLATNATPILNGQYIGHVVTNIAEGGYVAYVLSRATASGAKHSWGSDLPFGGFFTGFAGGLVKAVAPGLLTLLLVLLSLGMLLSYWLPAIPMLLWIFAGVNWFILFIQSLVACVLWWPAHANPEGDGWVPQGTRPGYMLVLSLFMTPALMLTGLFVAMLLMGATARLIRLLFPIMIITGHITSIFGILGFVADIALLTVIYVALADRVFAMIHVLRDSILKWISGPTGSLGEEQDSSRTRAMMVGVFGKFESSAMSGMKGGGGGKRRTPDNSKDTPTSDYKNTDVN